MMGEFEVQSSGWQRQRGLLGQKTTNEVDCYLFVSLAYQLLDAYSYHVVAW